MRKIYNRIKFRTYLFFKIVEAIVLFMLHPIILLLFDETKFYTYYFELIEELETLTNDIDNN